VWETQLYSELVNLKLQLRGYFGVNETRLVSSQIMCGHIPLAECGHIRLYLLLELA
jgi:hypothetical protein